MAQLKGDLNNDGRITMVDVPLCLKAAAGQFSDEVTVEGVVFRRGDVDGDGKTLTHDVIALVKHLQGEKLIDGVILGA
jgi:hypothetical protein